MRRFLEAAFGKWLVVVTVASVTAGASLATELSSTLRFEEDGPNLETQAVEERELHGRFRDAVDFHLGSHADRINPIVLCQNPASQVLIAFLDGELFEPSTRLISTA